MLWVTWRQHRGELVGAVALLAAIAVPLIVTGLGMRGAYHADGVADCVAASTGGGCEQIVAGFFDRYVGWGDQLTWLTMLPALAGVFIGAPLLGREFEQGTWKFAFTQTVTRTRWLATKLAVVGVGVLLVAAGFTALFAWWRAPLDAVEGRIVPTAFNLEGPTLAAATLFAFAAGVLAGVLLRRTVAAMAAALFTFIPVRALVEIYARPRYRTPRLRITDPAERAGQRPQPSTDWLLGQGWIDATGHKLSDAEQTTIVRRLIAGGSTIEQYMTEHGLRHYTEYHPASSFWTFQLTESAIYLSLAVTLLTAAIWLLRHRTT